MAYEVFEHVHVETNTPRGTEIFDFEPGVQTPDEDHRYVLEYNLIPAALARRVTDAPPAPAPVPEPAPVPDPSPVDPAPVEPVVEAS